MVTPGLTLGGEARIGANLAFSSREEFNLPAAFVGGAIVYKPVVDGMADEPAPGSAPAILDWLGVQLRRFVTLLIAGLVLVALFPGFLSTAAGQLRSRSLAAVGWGFVSLTALIFVLLVLIGSVAFLALLFGIVTLDDLLEQLS